MTPVRPWLTPLVPLYRLGLAVRALRLRTGMERVQRLQQPVVSIGNLSAGGAGKTPLAIALTQALARRGVAVDVLSRGYGRQSKLAARVEPGGSPRDFGDEPLLIARATGLPVYVAAQRYQAGLLAESEATVPAVHLLDDGFQHRQLHRDINILLLRARDLRDRLLPAGNLREPLSALRRATIIAIPDDEPEIEEYLREVVPAGVGTQLPRCSEPLWRLRRVMDVPPAVGPVLAFCGIARPEQFFAGLESGGLRLAARAAFRDHYAYTARDLHRLAAQASAAGATALVTTEKDRVRLEHLAGALPAELPLLTAGLRMEILDEEAAMKWLLKQLARKLARVDPLL